jgi:hypothetical protein
VQGRAKKVIDAGIEQRLRTGLQLECHCFAELFAVQDRAVHWRRPSRFTAQLE